MSAVMSRLVSGAGLGHNYNKDSQSNWRFRIRDDSYHIHVQRSRPVQNSGDDSLPTSEVRFLAITTSMNHTRDLYGFHPQHRKLPSREAVRRNDVRLYKFSRSQAILQELCSRLNMESPCMVCTSGMGAKRSNPPPPPCWA